MPDPTTTTKGFTKPSVGSDNNTWGGLLNTNFDLIDQAVGGTLALSISGTTTSITSTQAQNTGFEFTGSLSATNTITFPAFYGFAAINNGTTGGHSISCGISGGTFVTVLNGETTAIWSDGTNFYRLAQVGGGVGTTGSGSVVLATSATLVTPALGTPASGVATNLTGTASGLTAGSATALATARAIYGNNFDGTAALTGVIASTFGGTGNGFAKLSGPTTSEKTFTLPNASDTILCAGTSSTVTVGYKVTPTSLSNMTSFTPDPALGNYQYGTNHGAITITKPTSDCAIDILVTNDASAGAITFSGFTVSASTGDPLTTTNTSKFLLQIRVINSVGTYNIKALQ